MKTQPSGPKKEESTLTTKAPKLESVATGKTSTTSLSSLYQRVATSFQLTITQPPRATSTTLSATVS